MLQSFPTAESSNDVWGNDKPEHLEAGYELATDVEQIVGTRARISNVERRCRDGARGFPSIPMESASAPFSRARRGTRAFTLQDPRAAMGTRRRDHLPLRRLHRFPPRGLRHRQCGCEN
jgi:hypothetical protein